MSEVIYGFFESSWLEYPDNSSLAIIFSVFGCPHKCPGCHSPHTQTTPINSERFNINDEVVYGKVYSFTTVSKIEKVIRKLLQNENTNKLVITGGDPLFNNKFIVPLLHNLQDVEKCLYTGYTMNKAKEIIRTTNYQYATYDIVFDNMIYKCGTFINEMKQESFKNDEEMVLASKNQNFYDNRFNQLSVDGKLVFGAKNE